MKGFVVVVSGGGGGGGVCVCVCVRAFVRACVCVRAPACVCVCVRARARACLSLCLSEYIVVDVNVAFNSISALAKTSFFFFSFFSLMSRPR